MKRYLGLLLLATMSLAAMAKDTSSNLLPGGEAIENMDISEASPQSSFTRSLFFAISMIFGCELGDKTFIVAALLSFENSRGMVFLGSYSALFCMTLLGVLLGHAAPMLFPKQYTDLLGGLLFVIFGVKMIREGIEAMNAHESIDEEFKRVEDEIKTAKPVEELMEEGSIPKNHVEKSEKDSVDFISPTLDGLKNLFGFLLSPLFVKAFALTFVSEWGDRSQIATIAMAASDNMFGVFLGANLGHAFCTGLAVLSGKYLATKIQMHKVLLSGGCLFIIFGLVYFYQGFS
ncbi:Golgi Ca(2+)/H(+) antiporter Gdt2 [Schizosaccharomyces osmophilus]|uniref:GDT1 family protein n=1 Tax=Schizosaccharomyces osmophilus TaxID=2545709 RepID=A0AAE9WEA1_9SCHI|nr:Golgi Ca(2+)/H(+) antiporter Gdt2 [Schizosaccharomyces osmophilus]WBW73632.1 Golgi Ca(2+)/H(+) antiporter Gdt2 [Schizosaccharomyces osmophilus]